MFVTPVSSKNLHCRTDDGKETEANNDWNWEKDTLVDK